VIIIGHPIWHLVSKTEKPRIQVTRDCCKITFWLRGGRKEGALRRKAMAEQEQQLI